MAPRALVPLVIALAANAAAQSFPEFESPQTCSIEVSADGQRLYAVETADNRLSVFSLRDPQNPVLLREVQVGLEPVAVRERHADEVWVVDHLGDSISVVAVTRGAVIATIPCEDEPADVVFAGPGNARAFVTVATNRRVLVFDANTRARIGQVDVFGDEPRALARSADGTRVFAVVHRSGNKTTIVPEDKAPAQPPPTNPALPAPPRVGLIVNSDDPTWKSTHGVTLPDTDVVEIDAATLATTRTWSGVGTLLFGLAAHPQNGEVWVTNTEARNLVRFEPTLRGHIVDSRVTRLRQNGNAEPFDLNPGISYAVLPNPAALASALAQPTGAVFAPDGSELYVAAFGTDRIGVVDLAGNVVARIEIGNTPGTTVRSREKRGPRGLAHHPTARVLYVLNRLSASVTVVDTVARTQLREIAFVHDPTPRRHKEGRGFLYDAKLSGNGTSSCASCHADATVDGIAWDLGDPGGNMITVTTLFGIPLPEHPMKGPMTTQTLQGLKDTGPLHWRGDRPRFQDFNGAFDRLMGGAEIPRADMDDYAAFIDAVVFPSNPNLNRDRSLPTTPAGTSPANGFALYTSTPFRSIFRCVDCHSLTTGTNGVIIPDQILAEPQHFKVPQLRSTYKRTGRVPQGGLRTSGFGLLHDGSIDSVFGLLSMPVFGSLSTNTNNKTMLQNFVLHFDTGMAPTVGFARTVDQQNRLQMQADVNLLVARAAAGDCDVVALGTIDGRQVGFVYRTGTGDFRPDRTADPVRTLSQLDALIAQGRARLTFQGVVPGQGTRIGIDRDLDTVLNGDEGRTPYGQGTAGCGLELGANSEPRVGNAAFALVCEGAPPSAGGALLLGFAPAQMPFLGVTLLVDPAQAFALDLLVDARGTGTSPIAIPPDPTLAGVTLHAQAIVVAACGPQGIAASGGLTLTLQP